VRLATAPHLAPLAMEPGTRLSLGVLREAMRARDSSPVRTQVQHEGDLRRLRKRMSSPYIANAVISLTRRQPEDLSLLYISTASYDIAKYRRMQTGEFSSMGVAVRSLDVPA
jgi:hypothetical protein